MRILFQYFTGGGGALSNIILLLKALSKVYPQDNIDIVCNRKSALHSLELLPNVEVLSYGGNRFTEINRIILGFKKLAGIAKERNADIIWSMNLGVYSKTKVPHILSVNNPHQIYPWNVTRYHSDSRLHVALLRWFFRKSLRVSNAVIIQTPIMGELIRKITGSPKCIHVVTKAVENAEEITPEPINDGLKNSLEEGLGRNAFTFLYVATSSPHKNHKTLIDAFEILYKENVNVRVVMTLNNDELLAFGENRVRILIEKGYIVPAGWIKKEHLKSTYDACDACLMPSVLESLSSAHLEAMRWGKPQIVADLHYAYELCGDAALYADAENPNDWVEKIKKLMLDNELRSILRKSGYERMDRFPKTWAEVAHAVHKIFEHSLKKNN